MANAKLLPTGYSLELTAREGELLFAVLSHVQGCGEIYDILIALEKIGMRFDPDEEIEVGMDEEGCPFVELLSTYES